MWGSPPSPCLVQERAEFVYNYTLVEALAPVNVANVDCRGDEGSLWTCAKGQVRPGRLPEGCSRTEGLAGISCGPFNHAGPEMCYTEGTPTETCWNRHGYGSGATMACGTAGKRRSSRPGP